MSIGGCGINQWCPPFSNSSSEQHLIQGVGNQEITVIGLTLDTLIDTSNSTFTLNVSALLWEAGIFRVEDIQENGVILDVSLHWDCIYVSPFNLTS